ncbi:Exodeoxyribonuclease V alpha chain [Shimia thalassica]|uniref:Exodeoxyribonuclease V alpha chain n=1 Tax=Shimia thalassica TaxID=1715693 RepID=A0A0N7M9L8_9RHOB|nr:AAA family ATPase [Shimia thalassica]CUK00997.1 Exodeoxyribonuclease V alpha chain [Shimia thalassica]
MLVQIHKARLNGLLSAKRLSDEGFIIHSSKGLSVRFPRAVKDVATPGNVWRISGPQNEASFEVNGYTVTEDRIDVDEAELIKPNTSLIETWLQKNIDGIGEVKAGRLARNPNLLDLIENEDFDALLDLGIPSNAARQILKTFPRDEMLEAINWLAEKNFPARIAHSLSGMWKDKTVEYLEADPFVLLQFGVPFNKCCEVAESIGISRTSNVYQAAQVRDIVQKYTRKTGSTAIPVSTFHAEANRRRLNPQAILKSAADRRVLAQTPAGLQLEGPFLLEHFVAHTLKSAFNRPNGAGSLLAGWETALSDREISVFLTRFEAGISFELTSEQRQAVIGAVKSKVCAMSGGAGTGKTTILNAVLSIIDKVSLGSEVVQLALSGRAASRMSEATNRPAHTISKYIIELKRMAPERRPDQLIVVIDEASMVDIVSMYNLMSLLPSATRYIFVGDVEQLPPVGMGLVFHAIMESDIPRFHLRAVKRQGEDSGIHRFATAVRNSETTCRLPTFAESPKADCVILGTTDPTTIKELFENLGGRDDCIVLCPTDMGIDGVTNINKVIQAGYGSCRRGIQYPDEDGNLQHFVTDKGSRLHEGDAILVTKNDYALGLRNGFLGTISRAYDEPLDGSHGLAIIDGDEIQLTDEVISKLELGFAITIHKSQGSQWENVILALPASRAVERMLDKTLLYTGATRARQNLVVCCPDQEIIQRAIERGSLASTRTVNLLNHF